LTSKFRDQVRQTPGEYVNAGWSMLRSRGMFFETARALQNVHRIDLPENREPYRVPFISPGKYRSDTDGFTRTPP
jgi:hypothetical protein